MAILPKPCREKFRILKLKTLPPPAKRTIKCSGIVKFWAFNRKSPSERCVKPRRLGNRVKTITFHPWICAILLLRGGKTVPHPNFIFHYNKSKICVIVRKSHRFWNVPNPRGRPPIAIIKHRAKHIVSIFENWLPSWTPYTCISNCLLLKIILLRYKRIAKRN